MVFWEDMYGDGMHFGCVLFCGIPEFIDVYLHLSFSMWCVHRRLLSGENGVKVRGRELR